MPGILTYVMKSYAPYTGWSAYPNSAAGAGEDGAGHVRLDVQLLEVACHQNAEGIADVLIGDGRGRRRFLCGGLGGFVLGRRDAGCCSWKRFR